MKEWRLFIILSIALTATAAAPDDWIELKNDSLLAVSNAGADQSRSFLNKLELFRQMVVGILHWTPQPETPLVVMLFDSGEAFAPYRPGPAGQPADVKSYFRRGRERDMIAVNIGSQKNPSPEILREYMYRLAAHPHHPWPAWLVEGLAEFFAPSKLGGKKAVMGIPGQDQDLFLRDRRLLPLAELMRIGPGSPEYDEGEKRGLFRAQSWAFIHFLIFGKEGKLRPRLQQFVALLAQGGEARPSFEQAFDLSLDDLSADLLNYVRQNRWETEDFLPGEAPAKPPLVSSPLSEGQWKLHLGDLQLQIQHADQARELYQEVLDLGDPNGLATQRLAQLENADTPGAEIQSAIAQADDSQVKPPYLVHFELARSKFDDVGSAFSFGDEEVVAEAFQEVETAIRLNPDYAPAQHLFADLALLTGRRLEEAVKAAETAIRLDPEQEQYRITLAQIHMFSDHYAGAREAIQPVTQSSNETRAAYAKKMLENISILESRVKSEGVKPGAHASSPLSDSNCLPSFVEVHNLAHMEGILTRLECGPEGLIFVLESQGKEFRFIDPTPDHPVVFSCSVPLDELKCGSFDRPARVYYDRELDPGAGRVQAKAVEIRN